MQGFVIVVLILLSVPHAPSKGTCATLKSLELKDMTLASRSPAWPDGAWRSSLHLRGGKASPSTVGAPRKRANPKSGEQKHGTRKSGADQAKPALDHERVSKKRGEKADSTHEERDRREEPEKPSSRSAKLRKKAIPEPTDSGFEQEGESQSVDGSMSLSEEDSESSAAEAEEEEQEAGSEKRVEDEDEDEDEDGDESVAEVDKQSTRRRGSTVKGAYVNVEGLDDEGDGEDEAEDMSQDDDPADEANSKAADFQVSGEQKKAGKEDKQKGTRTDRRGKTSTEEEGSKDVVGSTTVHVSGVPYNASKEEVLEVVGKACGRRTLLDVRWPGRRNCGWGFMEFASKRAADNAIRRCEQEPLTLGGRTLRLKHAQPKAAKATPKKREQDEDEEEGGGGRAKKKKEGKGKGKGEGRVVKGGVKKQKRGK